MKKKPSYSPLDANSVICCCITYDLNYDVTRSKLLNNVSSTIDYKILIVQQISFEYFGILRVPYCYHKKGPEML